ncbi:hypothetical protein L289_0868 [Acinetobacter gerneri DSM 14967 = CIP 107464 = MTCC 9824]|nr:hypothetical protein L289_0868 [Acinetobacter gerneri DSM 14967 = CIP 107464 = MTCC 9824]
MEVFLCEVKDKIKNDAKFIKFDAVYKVKADLWHNIQRDKLVQIS